MHRFKLSPSHRSRASALITCLIAIGCGDPDANSASPSEPSATGAPQQTEHVALELALSPLADSSARSDLQAVTQTLVRDATGSHRDAADSHRDATGSHRDDAADSHRDATSSHRDDAAGSHRNGATASSVSRAARRLAGLWRTKTFEQGAWVDLIWVIGKQHAWHVVTAYADEQLTIPLVRWDIVRQYEFDQPSGHAGHPRETPQRYDLVWTDLASWLTPYVNNPELYQQIGLDDCELVAGERRDVSTDNCGAPLFPFRQCPLLDFVELTDDRMTFGDPRQGDRCEHRPTHYEAWSFDRVHLTPELLRRLAGT